MAKQRNKQSDTFTKLLASENINIVRDVAETARFNVDTRTLVCPLFVEDMPTEVSNLLLSHEVGHALYTPRMEEIESETKKLRSEISSVDNQNFHTYMNIVEDARIEKLIKKEYPGLRADYYRGYKHLVENNFFGGDLSSAKDVANRSFMDRMNIHFKCGSLVDVPFSDSEQKIIDRMKTLESFKDVVAILEDLFDKSNENEDAPDVVQSNADDDQQNDQDDASEQPNTSDADSDQSPNDEAEDKADDDDTDESESTPQNSDDDVDADADEDENSDEDTESSDSDTENDEDEESKSENESASKSSNSSSSNAQDEDTIHAEHVDTEDVLEEAIKKYAVPNDTQMNIQNMRIDSPCLDALPLIVNSYESMKDSIARASKEAMLNESISRKYKAFNNSIKPLVSSMSQTFKRHQAADEYQKTRIAKTGDIDSDALYSYKFNDDIFKRSSVVPKGKKHGMFMLVDFSSSMVGCIDDTIKQIIMTCRFCKSIRVPFQVYTFTSTGNASGLYQSNGTGRSMMVQLNEMFSSKMSNQEFENAAIAYLYNRVDVPTISFGGTPITHSLEISDHLIDRFKKKNRVDMTTAILLTDGDGSDRQSHTRSGAAVDMRTYKVSVSSNLSGRIYPAGLPYSNALIQDMKHRHNLVFINTHISNRFRLPLNTDNQTGNRMSVSHDMRANHKANSITQVDGVGGFDHSYVIGSQVLGKANSKSKQFVKSIAKTFATNGKA